VINPFPNLAASDPPDANQASRTCLVALALGKLDPFW
jgi:hypothetical protein